MDGQQNIKIKNINSKNFFSKENDLVFCSDVAAFGHQQDPNEGLSFSDHKNFRLVGCASTHPEYIPISTHSSCR